MDCFAQGYELHTCSSNDAGSRTAWIETFSDTSGASAIIAGAAIILQGVARANGGRALAPMRVRELLGDCMSGAYPGDPVADPCAPGVSDIGFMPRLAGLVKRVLSEDCP